MPRGISGLSGANVSRGISSGQAQIYDTSGNVNLYAKILAQQKAQRESEVNDLQKYLTTAKTEGLRDADKDDYFKGYNEWRDKAVEAYKAPSGIDKAKLRADADKKLASLNALVKQSSDYNKLHQDIAVKLLDDRFRNQIQPDGVKSWQESANLPLSSSKIIKDPSTLARQIDTSKVLDKFAKINDQVMQTTGRYDNDLGTPIKNGSKTGLQFNPTKRGDSKTQALNYGMAYDTDPEIKAFIQKQYADHFNNMSEDEAKNISIQDLVIQNPLIKTEAPRVDWDRAPDNFYAHFNYKNTNGTPVTTESDIRKQWIGDMKNKVPGSGEKLGAFIQGSPLFSGGTQFHIGGDPDDPKNPDAFEIDVPDKLSYNSKGEPIVVIPRNQYSFKYSDPNFETKMNSFINEITGQRMDIGGSIGLKGNVKGSTKSKAPSNTTNVTMSVDGKRYVIPSDKISGFMKSFPKAKRL